MEGRRGAFATKNVVFSEAQLSQTWVDTCANTGSPMCYTPTSHTANEEITCHTRGSRVEVFPTFDSMDKQEREPFLEVHKSARQKTARLANKKTADPALVEDAVHEHILSVLKYKARTGIKNLPAYLVRTACREVRSSAGVRKREARHVEQDSFHRLSRV